MSDTERLISAMADLPFAGVELGGTKCVCTLAYGPDTILDQRTIPTTSPEETLPTLLAILKEWHGDPGFAGLGLASFGPLDLNQESVGYGRILATAKLAWRDADVLGILSAPFAIPLGFDTDVNGAAIAEMLWGSGQGLHDFAYVTVGTGVGVGLIVHGLPTRGIGHSEIGHVRVPRLPGDSVPSVCPYHSDCVEGLASGTALASRLAGRSPAGLAPDDPVWEPIVHALTAMCHSLACGPGPQRIAIGGGVLSSQPHLIRRINDALVQSLGGYIRLPEGADYIVAPRLLAQAGPLGSIALAISAARKGKAEITDTVGELVGRQR